jgi:hypothetical protein
MMAQQHDTLELRFRVKVNGGGQEIGDLLFGSRSVY